MGKKVSPEGSDQYSLTRKRFLKAGLRWEGAPSVFWGIKILLPVIMVAMFIVLQMNITGPPTASYGHTGLYPFGGRRVLCT